MTEYLIEWDSKGRCITCKNYIGTPDGGIKHWEGDINGVLLQVFPDYDEDGTRRSRVFLTMLIADPEMEDLVRKEADKVLKALG